MIEGSGEIAGPLDDRTGIIWWKMRANHYQSVLYSRGQREELKTGDRVTFTASRTPCGPSNWRARRVVRRRGTRLEE